MSLARRHKHSTVSVDIAQPQQSGAAVGSSSESLATLSARLRKISGTVSDADSSQG